MDEKNENVTIDADAPGKSEEPVTEAAPADPVVEETETAPADPPAESMQDYTAELEASFRKINEDDILSGTVIDVNEEEVILDLMYYTQGIIKAEDYSDAPDFSILHSVRIGDTVEASVVKLDDGAGSILLSRKNANKVLAWDKLKKYLEDETKLDVKITGVTNGGAVAYLEDIRGFIPASQLSLEYVEDVNPWLHKTLQVKVITVDQEKEKLVMSAKVILREEEKEAHDRRVSMIVPGTVLEGTVESLMPYGAFINLGSGLSGLVHISQISQRRIKKPSEVLAVGDKIKAKVLKTENGKISLSMKVLEENAEADSLEAFDYKSEGDATTSLGSLFANLKLDLDQ